MTALPAPVPRLVPLRVGLVLAAAFGLLGLAPLLDIGFDGTSWDVILVVFAALAVVIAVGCVVFAVLGWNGRRGPAIGVIVLTALSVLPALPAFFLPAVETTAEGPGPLLAVIGILIAAAVIVLVAIGARGRR